MPFSVHFGWVHTDQHDEMQHTAASCMQDYSSGRSLPVPRTGAPSRPMFAHGQRDKLRLNPVPGRAAEASSLLVCLTFSFLLERCSLPQLQKLEWCSCKMNGSYVCMRDECLHFGKAQPASISCLQTRFTPWRRHRRRTQPGRRHGGSSRTRCRTMRHQYEEA